MQTALPATRHRSLDGRTPTIVHAPCRPLCPGDEDELQRLHAALFPINYEMVFFQKAVRGHDNIFSWAALQTCAFAGALVVGLDPLSFSTADGRNKAPVVCGNMSSPT